VHEERDVRQLAVELRVVVPAAVVAELAVVRDEDDERVLADSQRREHLLDLAVEEADLMS
jgi:hypothetical protein